VTDPNPTFLVTTSQSEFITDGSFRAATAVFYPFGSYFCYSSFNSNFIFENAEFTGYGRFTDNPKNQNGTDHIWGPSTPLYLLTKYQSFTSSDYIGENMLWEISEASGLYWRNLITSVLTNRVIIDNSRVWWNRQDFARNLVELRNFPTLMVGDTFGETRLLDVITDGTGMTVEDSAAFAFSGLFPNYDLSNIYLKNTGYISNNRDTVVYLWGDATSNVDISNFTADAFDTWYGGIVYARKTGFPVVSCALNVTGDGGITGFRVDGTFTNNFLILTNWTIRAAAFNPTGWSRLNNDNGNSWPATHTPPVLPNLSIT
jgi:hypothetical protein